MTTTVNSSTSAQLLAAADGTRTSLTIQNTDANELFLGRTSGVTISSFELRRPYGTGYVLTPPDSYSAWYGIWDADGSGGAVITEVVDPITDTNGAGITTYALLKTAVANWLRPGSTPTSDMTSRIPQYVGLAEVAIRRELDLRSLHQADTALAINDGTATVPTGFQSVISMRLDDEPRNQITGLALDQIEALDPTRTDKPRHYTRVGSLFRFWPPTDATARLFYRRNLTPLSADNDTNWILAGHPDVYLYGSLIHADRRLIGPRLGEWKEGFAQALDSIGKLERRLHADIIRPMPNGAVV